jgi:hypothetical protein
MRVDEEKAAEVRKMMSDATTAFHFRVATELRRNPEFFGLMSLELCFKEGRIAYVKPIVAETIVPEKT